MLLFPGHYGIHGSVDLGVSSKPPVTGICHMALWPPNRLLSVRLWWRHMVRRPKRRRPGGTRKVEKAFESEPEGANEKSKSRTTRKKSKSRTARETRTKTNTRLLCRLLLRLLLRHLRVLLSLTLSLLICLLLSPSVSGSRHLLCLLL